MVEENEYDYKWLIKTVAQQLSNRLGTEDYEYEEVGGMILEGIARDKKFISELLSKLTPAERKKIVGSIIQEFGD